MAARTPRRSFATPFVITLAAAPACIPANPPPQQPTQSQPQPQPDQTQPHPVVVNPPRPQPPQPEPSTLANQKWTVSKAPDGSCMATLKVECGPNETCNQPAPFKYECPPNVSLDTAVTVAASADGTACFVEYAAMKCPPNVACNPPRPRPVSCPTR